MGDTTIECPTCGSDGEFYWKPATNEDGWLCTCGHRPGEPPGYSPALDRAETYTKVECLLDDLATPLLISISNGSQADMMAQSVAVSCRESGRFDQSWIISGLVSCDLMSHSTYWQTIGDGVIAGKDPRDRCGCGELATSSSNVDGHKCRKCREASHA